MKSRFLKPKSFLAPFSPYIKRGHPYGTSFQHRRDAGVFGESQSMNKEKVDSVSRTGTDPNAPTESTCTITIDDLAKKVNGSTMRYFPDHFFCGDRLNAKRKYEEEALIHFESKLKKKNWNTSKSKKP